MAFKFVICCAFLAAASATHVQHAGYAGSSTPNYVHPSVYGIGSIKQDAVRSSGSGASFYSQSTHTPYSSVNQADRRLNNNLYTPAIGKSVTYAAPAPAPAFSYAAAVPLHTKTMAAAHTPMAYRHVAPAVKQAVAYSPASSVAHVSFQGFGSHWGY